MLGLAVIFMLFTVLVCELGVTPSEAMFASIGLNTLPRVTTDAAFSSTVDSNNSAPPTPPTHHP